MKFIIASLLGLTAAGKSISDEDLNIKFLHFLAKYGKDYKSKEEFEFRKAIFEANYELVYSHNSNPDKRFTMGMNKFADLTDEEYSGHHKHDIQAPKHQDTGRRLRARRDPFEGKHHGPVQESLDWRQIGYVSSVKDQTAGCFSSYALAANDGLESAWFIKTGERVNLSAQQLVDCSGPYGNKGCNYGFMAASYLYYADNAAIVAEDYPYTAKEGACQDKNPKGRRVTKTDEYWPLEYNEWTVMHQALQYQPVVTAVAAGSKGWKFYEQGIIDDYCGGGINTGVNIVGYGTEKDQAGKDLDYWIVKAPYGVEWGEQGYARIWNYKIDSTIGLCGIHMESMVPLLPEDSSNETNAQ